MNREQFERTKIDVYCKDEIATNIFSNILKSFRWCFQGVLLNFRSNIRKPSLLLLLLREKSIITVIKRLDEVMGILLS